MEQIAHKTHHWKTLLWYSQRPRESKTEYSQVEVLVPTLPALCYHWNVKYESCYILTLLHSEQPKLLRVLAVLSAIRLKLLINFPSEPIWSSVFIHQWRIVSKIYWHHTDVVLTEPSYWNFHVKIADSYGYGCSMYGQNAVVKSFLR